MNAETMDYNRVAIVRLSTFTIYVSVQNSICECEFIYFNTYMCYDQLWTIHTFNHRFLLFAEAWLTDCTLLFIFSCFVVGILATPSYSIEWNHMRNKKQQKLTAVNSDHCVIIIYVLWCSIYRCSFYTHIQFTSFTYYIIKIYTQEHSTNSVSDSKWSVLPHKYIVSLDFPMYFTLYSVHNTFMIYALTSSIIFLYSRHSNQI